MTRHTLGPMLEYTVLSIRFVISLIFVLAGVSKFRDRPGFQKAVEEYRLLPPNATPSVVRWLPVMELTAGLMLALGVAQRPVAVALILLLTVFGVAVGANLVRGRRIDCGCLAATGGHRISWWTVVRNLGLIGLAAMVWRWPSASLTPLSSTATDMPATDASAAIALSSVIVVLVLLIGEAGRLHRLVAATRAGSGL